MLRPAGTGDNSPAGECRLPSDKSLGYFQMSLRDKLSMSLRDKRSMTISGRPFFFSMGVSRRRRFPPRHQFLCRVQGMSALEDLGHLGRETSAAHVAAPDHPFRAQLANGHFHGPRAGIESRQPGVDVLRAADDADAQLPVSSQVGGDNLQLGVAFGQLHHVLGVDSPGSLPPALSHSCCRMSTSLATAHSAMGSMSGTLQRTSASISPIITIGPSRTQRSNSLMLKSNRAGVIYTEP